MGTATRAGDAHLALSPDPWIVAFCAFQSRDLLEAWTHAPPERGMWLLLLAWCLPLLRRARPDRRLLVAAAALSAAGTAASLHVVHHAALALALAACGPAGGARWVWLSGAAAWMPAAGWALTGWSRAAAWGVRATIVAVAAGCGWWGGSRR